MISKGSGSTVYMRNGGLVDVQPLKRMLNCGPGARPVNVKEARPVNVKPVYFESVE